MRELCHHCFGFHSDADCPLPTPEDRELGAIQDEFHAERLTGIGGSDAAATVGLSPWHTPYDLWLEKIGEREPLETSELMLWGKLIEPIILDEYSRRTGRRIGRNLPLIRHPDYDWMICHLDARVLDTNDIIIECKMARSDRGWGEEGTDQMPQHYSVQCHHCLIVAQAQVCDVPVLIGGNDLRIYRVHADPVIAAALIEAERAFWRLVIDRVPPPPINTADATRRWGRMTNPGAVFATDEDMTAIETLRYCRDCIREYEAREEKTKLHLLERLSDLGDTLVDLAGTPLATWKLDHGRRGYTVEPREPSRRFLLKD